jgi:hypothetical protein
LEAVEFIDANGGGPRRQIDMVAMQNFRSYRSGQLVALIRRRSRHARMPDEIPDVSPKSSAQTVTFVI